MLRKKRLAVAVSAAISMGTAAVLPMQAFAQEDLMLEEVVVTGSRIARPDLDAAAPVTVLQREEMTTMGVNNVGDILQNLVASAGAAANTGQNNGGEGRIGF